MSGNTKGIATAPSAAHLCRLIGKSPEETAKLIIDFRSKKIPFRTWPAVSYLRARLNGADADFLASQANKDSNKHAGKAASETLPLVSEYMEQHPFDWFQPLNPVKLVLTPTLQVPLKPIGMVGAKGEARLLAGQVWKHISLNPHSFRLWMTMLKVGFLDNNPDIDSVHWLEMSAPKKGAKRELNVRTIDAVGFYSDTEFSEYIRNIDAAMAIVDSVKKPSRPKKPDPKQQSFDLGTDD